MLARALPGVVVAVGPAARRGGPRGRGALRPARARARRRLPAPAAPARPRPRLPRRARPRGPADAGGAPARGARGPRPGGPRPPDPARGRVRGRDRRPRGAARAPNAPCASGRRVSGWRTLDGAPAAPPARVFLLAAIARPERFERDVAGCGVAVPGAPSSATTTASAPASSPGWRPGPAPRGRRRSPPPPRTPSASRARRASACRSWCSAIAADVADEDRLRDRLLVGRGEGRVKRERRHALEAARPPPSCRRSCAACRGGPCWPSAAGSAGCGGPSTGATSRSRPTTCGVPSPSGTRRASRPPRAASTATSRRCSSTSSGWRGVPSRS
jgi:hypothetical protein